MNTGIDDEMDEELDDYEAGFLDGYFAARGIDDPSEEQLVEAFRALEEFIERHQANDEE